MKELLFVIIQVIANTVQAITGFAGGPIAIPPSMALVGVENAKASITLILLFVTAIVTVQNFKDVNWKQLGIMLAFMIVGMIPGVWLFSVLPTKALMIIYGTIVVLIGVEKLVNKNTKDMNSPWNYVAPFFAGIMQGMFTSGGPFIALYATGAIKDKKQFRATVTPVWTVLNIYLVSNMFMKGFYTPYVMKLTGLAIIPVFGSIFLGNKIANKIEQKTFLKLVYMLLILSGGILLFTAFTK